MEALLTEQTECMKAIARTLPNIKKLGQKNFTVAKLQSRLQTLKENFNRCKQLHWQLQSLASTPATKEHPYFQQELFLQCEEQYDETADFIAEWTAQLQTEPSTSMSSLDATLQSNDAANRSISSLPRISLPTFAGELSEWESFRDRFRALIINDHSLSDVTRLHYLGSSLKGEASQIIKTLPITDANFTVAWNLLTSRFDNNRRLVQIHIRTLMSLPTVPFESAAGLRSLRDQTNTAIQALKNLSRPVESWDDILVFLVTEKLDKSSRKAWELLISKTHDHPSYTELDQHLESRICALEAIQPSNPRTKGPEVKSRPLISRSLSSHTTTTSSLQCPLCQGGHGLYLCPSFKSKTPQQRFDFVKSQNRCLNCLSPTHQLRACSSKYTCRKCKRQHHTLLHFNQDSRTFNENTEARAGTQVESSPSVTSHAITNAPFPRSNVLLATARVCVSSVTGRKQTVRALLDQGSVVTVISEKLARRLKVPRQPVSVAITGIGDAKSAARSMTSISVSPRNRNGPAYTTTALILDNLSRYTPLRATSRGQWKHLEDLTLADPDPMSSDSIDILIGADLYGFILLNGLRTSARSEPIAQNTIFGWILSGPNDSCHDGRTITGHHVFAVDDLDQELRRFWEIENVSSNSVASHEDKKCEQHFVASHSRDPSGRYVVRIPFKEGPPLNIGQSRPTALTMLTRLETRLRATPDLHAQYTEFLDEYERLGHMRRVPPDASTSKQTVYIPHHAVVRPHSQTTKLRVVFNASQRTSNGTSLNDHQWTGPKLQSDLFSVLLRWRQFQFVLTADIVKMYRQILIDPLDVDYQRILWRRSPSEPIADYQLLTVTYGTASAPYLALRVLRQLADDEGSKFPNAGTILHRHTYVDDCIFGADNIESALQHRNELIALLSCAHFELSKWSSNSPKLLNGLDSLNRQSAEFKTLSDNDNLKVLGISWYPTTDSIRFQALELATPANTKRGILSAIAKLYDPLGWVAPVIVTAKILMQQLWLSKCTWDDPIHCDLQSQWDEFHAQLPCLSRVSIPRWTHFTTDTQNCQLHGFADASSQAYAAVVYLRVVSPENTVVSSLLAAKTKVAPLKTLSIPRLELCAALLLSDLLSTTLDALGLSSISCYGWSDSTITLHWISQPPNRWKTFVANRVAKIQTTLPHASWRHIPSMDNPADCASRGVLPSQIIENPLWWRGPPWLQKPESEWPATFLSEHTGSELEERAIVCSHSSLIEEPWDLASRYSSWPKLLRVTAYIFRFVMHVSCKSSTKLQSLATLHADEFADKPPVSPQALRAGEIYIAKAFWIRRIQAESFAEEFTQLKQNRTVPRHSPLSSLNPFLDANEIIRVGGRLKYASISNSAKHPIVLKSHSLTALIIRHAHVRTLHAGSQLTLHVLRQEYWLLRSRPTVRAVLHKCIPCARERAQPPAQIMGDLPSARVTRSTRAFLHCGLDYAGPLHVRASSLRVAKSYKAYIALFICLVVKAVHLELVSDYTTAAFLAAFRRFCARRGLPVTMYSDNGTNFRGADREMTQAYRQATRDPNVLNKLASDNISWKFIPPSAPHFGGLWEAAVRSVKYHIKRVIGHHVLTFEELSTLLCEVEACLNSRPLAPLSDHIDDFNALTPGHFLIGSSMTTVPTPTLLHLKESRLSRWQLLQQMYESFWRSWTHDYMHNLQQRKKWKIAKPNILVGQLVLVRNALEPPCKWALGRIIECLPGKDGQVRVVKLKTATSEFLRPISQICLLPVDPEEPIK